MGDAAGVAVSYVCSILPPKSAGVCLTPATAQEVAVGLMVVTNSAPTQYVFRLSTGDGATAFVTADDFGYGAAANTRLWYDFYACARRMFCIQAVYMHGQLRGSPSLLRVYAKTGLVAAGMASRMTGRAILDNEQALVNLMQSCMGRIVAEPLSSLSLARDALLDAAAAERGERAAASSARFAGISPLPRAARRVIPARRALASEQRAAAQALVDTTQRIASAGSGSALRLPVRSDLPIVADLSLDFNTWALHVAPPGESVVAEWKPRAGFVLASRGSGRRRTLAAVADALAFGPDAGSGGASPTAAHASTTMAPTLGARRQRLNEFAAPRLVVIVCADAAVPKWQDEVEALGMAPPTIIRTRDDYDALTYRVASAGGVVLVTHAALAQAPALAKAAADHIRDAMHTDAVFGSGLLMYRGAPPKLNHARSVRVHVGSFAARFPDAVAPLAFLRTRCVIVDDAVDVDACAQFVTRTGRSTTMADARATLRTVSSLPTDWTWIVAAFTGPPPTHLPMQTLEVCEDLLALPELARFVDEDARFDTILPDVWRLVHEPGAALVHRLCFPKPLLRKVTIVPVIVSPTDAEVGFLDAVRRMTAAAAVAAGAADADMPHAPGLSVEQRSAILLCAAPAPSADGGCALHVALARTVPLTLTAARASVAAHFDGGRLRGTLAQRIMGAASAAAGCEVVHVERVLDPSSREAACQICFADPPTRISLCGHAFCAACVDMLRRPEVRAGTIPCPCCRAPLSAYDWLSLVDAPASSASSSTYVAAPSKVTAARAVLREAFGRRRPKRRCAVYTAWVVAPSASAPAIAQQLRDGEGSDAFAVQELDDSEDDELAALDEPVADEDARAGRHRVFVLTFEELSARCARGPIGEAVEAVVFACPAPSTRTYYELVAAASGRATALQTHILVASGLEDVRPALQSLLEPSEEPVRRIIRRPARRAPAAAPAAAAGATAGTPMSSAPGGH